MKHVIFLFLLIKLSIGFSQLNGIYTIGGTSPNYATINNAILALTSSGVNGPVTFNIRPGTYNEKIIIPSITGASETNRITFQSELLDSSSVKIINNSNLAADNYIFYLNGTDYISLKHLSLNRNLSSANGCRIIRFENSANCNIVENCHLTGKATSTSSNHELIYSTNSQDTGNIIKNNIIENGWYSILFNSTSGLKESGNKIEGNKFIGSLFGISVIYFSGISINNNNISTINISVGLNYGSDRASISNNKILTGNGTSISVSNYSPTAASDSLKIIGNMTNIGNGNGINLSFCNNVDILQNSILAYATSADAPLNCTNSSLRLYNNIIKNSAASPSIKFGSPSQLNSDYNIIYTPGNILLTYSSNSFANLTSWSSFVPHDQHSFQANPTFISNNDLHIASDFNASNNGYNLNVQTDLDSDIRTNTPDIGADEFEQPDDDAGIHSITNIASPVCSGTTAVMVNIRNYGESPLTQASINWSVNGIIQPTYNWTGNLNYTNISTAISIGTISIIQNLNYNLKVWTTNPNNFTDVITANDSTITGPVITKLSGNYTIGGSSPSYTSIASAINDLSVRGICSPVVFELRPGDYIEPVNLIPVNGASTINTITFQSENQDSTTTRILLSDGNFSSYRLMTNTQNSAYYTFKQLTIGRTDDPSGSTNNLVALFKAKNISFNNCIFKCEHLHSGWAIDIDECSNITIKNCLLDGMAYGIDILGGFQLNDSVFIIENNILNNIAMNIKIDQVKNTQITNNIIINDTIGLPSNIHGIYGIAISRISGNFDVISNKISGHYDNALNVGNLSANATYTRNISNNFIAATCPAGSNQESTILFYSINNLDFIHNSIRVNKMPLTPNTTAGKYRSAFAFGSGTPCSNIRMLNNSFESDSSIYLFFDYTSANIPISFSQFDYNNFYIKYPTYTQISSWTANWPNGYNTNSIYVDPFYQSLTDLHTSNPQLIAGIPTYITNDIDGDIRAVIPTIGADECNPIITKINTSSLENIYKIAPNPSNAFFKISYEGYKNLSIQILSIDGKIVFEKTNYLSGEIIDLHKFEEGLYTVSMKTETENYFSKIVIIK